MSNWEQRKIGFALALLEIAHEEKKEQIFYNQSKLIIETLEQDLEMIKFFDDQFITFERKQQIIDKAFRGIHWSIRNTLMLLIQKQEFKNTILIFNELIKQLSQILNIKEAIIYSTEKITESKLLKIKKKLEHEFKSKVFLKNYIDKELLGGFRITIDDIVIENSIKLDLEDLKMSLIKNRGL